MKPEDWKATAKECIAANRALTATIIDLRSQQAQAQSLLRDWNCVRQAMGNVPSGDVVKFAALHWLAYNRERGLLEELNRLRGLATEYANEDDYCREICNCAELGYPPNSRCLPCRTRAALNPTELKP